MITFNKNKDDKKKMDQQIKQNDTQKNQNRYTDF